MIPMICTKALPYAGRRLKPGDTFNARGESDARLLVAIGKAARVPAPTPIPVAPPVAPRAPVLAAPEPASDPAPTQPAPAVEAPATSYTSATQERTKRAHRRRDLTAE